MLHHASILQQLGQLGNLLSHLWLWHQAQDSDMLCAKWMRRTGPQLWYRILYTECLQWNDTKYVRQLKTSQHNAVAFFSLSHGKVHGLQCCKGTVSWCCLQNCNPQLKHTTKVWILNIFLSFLFHPVFSRLSCTHSCLRERSSLFDFTACNGFLYEGGQCKLGYMDPNWVVQQRGAEDGKATETLFFDFILN